MNSAAMIDKCFRHQHPEAFGHVEVAEPQLPADLRLRYEREQVPAPSRDSLAEDDLGYPGAIPLSD